MSKYITCLLLFLTCFVCKESLKSQVLFEQGICKCGVTAGGFSTGQGFGSGTVNLHIEPGSTIKKAYLFTYTQRCPPKTTIIVNNIPYIFDSTSNCIMEVSFACLCATPSRLYVKDITSNLTASQTSTFNITIPSQLGLPINEGYWTTFLYIVYENPTLTFTNYSILINDKDLIGNEVYAISNLNPININFPVGFSLYTDRTGSNVSNNPSHYVYFNTNLLGIIGGSDAVNASWNNAGVKGHFYYQNNQLYGLDDDTPDAFMDSTDGLADVSSYLANLATSCNFQLKHIHYPNEPVNYNSINLAYFLTYTTPCDTFPVTVSPDTTICYGEQVQLYATGGQSYKWSATNTKDTSSTNTVPGLSCSTCLNPVFTGDSSMTYTVRIWNNDSCSVVRPVHINVSHPQKVNCYAGETKCGATTGYVKAINLPKDMDKWYVVTPNNDTLDQPVGTTFSGFGAGDYNVYYIDTLGCKSEDTLVTITSYNNTVADFTVNPISGSAPLKVQFENNSENATDFEWVINGVSNGTTPISIFDTSGVYQIGLVAWEIDKSCADTIYKNIYVYDSLRVSIPNVFTPDGNGVNDYFGVTVNLQAETNLAILNRWGNVVFEWNGLLKKGQNKLWDGKGKNGELVSDGVYFYRLEFTGLEGKEKERQMTGFVHVFGE